MKFSDRILKVKPSPTLAVTEMAAQLKSQGIDVLGFGSGEPDFDTPQHIKDAAIKAIEAGKTKYTPAGGLPQLKKAIIDKFLRDNKLDYRLSEIIVNCGGKHSFYNLMQVLLNNGDEVIIPSPYWVSFPAMVELAGGIPVILNTEAETNFKITPEQLKKSITRKTSAVVINSPSNPTGAAYTFDELKTLSEVILDAGILAISDDIYESIIYENYKFNNIANVSNDMFKKTIVLNGVSKTYAMTGWRIGYMAGNENIIKKVEILQGQSTSNPSSISQYAAIEALSGDQSAVSEMVKAFDRRRKLVVQGLNSIPGFNCYNPEGAFYVFPRVDEVYKFKGWEKIEEKYKDEYKSSSLCAYLLEEAKSAVVPGIGFGNDNYFRMSFATSDESLIEGIKRIREAIEKLT